MISEGLQHLPVVGGRRPRSQTVGSSQASVPSVGSPSLLVTHSASRLHVNEFGLPCTTCTSLLRHLKVNVRLCTFHHLPELTSKGGLSRRLIGLMGQHSATEPAAMPRWWRHLLSRTARHPGHRRLHVVVTSPPHRLSGCHHRSPAGRCILATGMLQRCCSSRRARLENCCQPG